MVVYTCSIFDICSIHHTWYRARIDIALVTTISNDTGYNLHSNAFLKEINHTIITDNLMYVSHVYSGSAPPQEYVILNSYN